MVVHLSKKEKKKSCILLLYLLEVKLEIWMELLVKLHFFVVLDPFDHVLLLLMGKIILRCTLNTNGMANLVVLLPDKEAFFDILYTWYVGSVGYGI